MKREIARFECVGENGRKYVVVEMREFIRGETMAHGVYEVPGATMYMLLDGSPVQRAGENSFKITLSDEAIRKV
jgi:hypothetical protein